MTKRERLHKRIRDIKFALDLVLEERVYYEKVMGGKDEVEKWIDYQLKFLKEAIDEFNSLN